MSYRDDLDALAARHDALDVELAEKTRELDKVAQQLEDAKERAKLPVLPNLRVATPCRADWNEMVGDERVRHCASCDKDVFNLSSMTREAAEALILAKAGNLCARYYQRQDGTILLADCEVAIAQKRKRKVIAAGAALLLGGGAAAWLLRPREPEYTMGSVGSIDGLDKETMATRVLANELEPPPPPEPLELPQVQAVEPDIRTTMGAVAITHEVVDPEPATVEIEK
jgi:hypothetical protein